jgi:hypothetical protein
MSSWAARRAIVSCGAVDRALVGEVERIALAEMRSVARAPRVLKPFVDRALRVPARALARSLASLDADTAQFGLAEAGRRRLRAYGAAPPRHDIFAPARGPAVVVSNHPGLFDCLALFAAIGRDDLSTLAADRPLLAALPNLGRRLAFISEGPNAAFALRGAVRHLASGGALLHFPAGEIEPDPRFITAGQSPLGAWRPGLELLLALAGRRVNGTVAVAALVSGVISKRARAVAAAVAGRRGATDAIVPLLQLTFPGFADVDLLVRFGPPRDPADSTTAATLRDDLERMALG